MSAHERTVSLNTDGTPMFTSAADIAAEDEILRAVGAKWGCEMHKFGGRLCPVDSYALRDGRLTGVVEVRRRYHASTKYETVFLSFRKWISLQLASYALGVPPVFAVGFDDGIWWIDTRRVSGPARMAGSANVKSSTDVELMFDVPLELMHKL